MADRKRCFVLMGFGVKVDYKTNRSLDLDKTYRIIRLAVEEAGLECIRADDLVHSGVIDTPMYEHLLNADVAIADLSTSNENAIYELGVRHALRPYTTIVIAERQFKFPFDLNSLLIRQYEHLGTGIDFEEAESLRTNLVTAIREIVDTARTDSPVYTFLPGLIPPVLRAVPPAPAAPAPATDTPRAGAGDPAFSVMLDAFREARGQEDFLMARAYLHKLRAINPSDVYLVQQHALATYKIRPVTRESLQEARTILAQLQPGTSGDPETLGLWGAIHKRLWDLTGDRTALDEGLAAYERGFYMKRDHYTGVNYAFMLDERAAIQEQVDEATADRVLARRVRRQLLAIVDDAENALPRSAEQTMQNPADWYWLQATRLEALFGLGDPRFAELRERLFASAPEPWMPATTQAQLARLGTLLGRPAPE